MSKTAQQKLNEYFDEMDAIRARVDRLSTTSYEKHKSFSYAAGFLGEMLVDAVSNLPKAKRDEFKQKLAKRADEFAKQI